MREKWRGFAWLLLVLPVWVLAKEQPDLLLLKKYSQGMDVSGWYMSEKLDGVRAYWNGRQLLSRKGRPFAAPAWFTRDFPPFEMDGELWIGRGRFEDVASITSRRQPHSGWRDISYNIFEVPNASGGLDARLARLRDYLSDRPVSHLRIIPQVICEGDAHLQAKLQEVDAAGGEGLVLRNPHSSYETGRSANAIKAKRFDDMEGRVIGYRPGKGKYAGMVGALQVEIAGGIRFYIGSGLKDRDRENPPPLGAIITFRYQGFTDNGIPRFATFLRVREMPATDLSQ